MAFDSNRAGMTIGTRPQAYDPAANPELFEGVLACRMLAFVIDLFIIAVPIVFASAFILLLGFVTLGLGWLLFLPFHALWIVWALLYYGFTFGGSASATLGMRLMEIEMRTSYGAPSYFVLGAVHAVLYWVSVSALTPLILLVALFNGRRRLLHDMLLGTVMINSPARASRLTRRFRGH